ncbi:MAG: hypothetical protein KAT17_05975 [Candidatus Aminicenantes bacterium]|nr:hypothetical protein [Candidatus Aminicenantes bacterium]
MKRFNLFLFCIVLFSSLVLGIQSPDEFLGFSLGSDKNLAHYSQIKTYFEQIGRESPRVKIRMIGKTTQNHDMIMAVISLPENLKQLDSYQNICSKLSLAKVEKQEAKKLSRIGKAVVFVTCNIHSTEIGSSQMAMKILHKMASENTPEILQILKEVIFVLVPSVNPDGQMMVVDWYNKYKGTPYEGGSLPYLYHPYAGHDNNRDWFKINLKETWNITNQLYFKWFPQILVDEHQMGSSGDRFFIPPFQDPPTPGVHPLVWRTINLVGSGIAFDLGQRNYRGVASRGFFTGWWIGALDDSAWFHNIPGILFEAASVRVASPVFIEPEEVRSGESRMNEERIFSPDPWTGGWWRLQDIIDYNLHATLSVLKTAAIYRQELLWNSYQMAVDNINKGKKGSPFAYLIPLKQKDSLTAKKFIKTLLKSNISVLTLTEALQLNTLNFEAGSFVIPLAQPYRSFVSSLLSSQHYPDLRRNPSESPILPYDSAGWTLHLGMGVEVKKICQPFQAQMKSLTLDDLNVRELPGNMMNYLILDSRYNNSFMAASVLLKRGVPIWRNESWDKYSKGSFLVEKSRSLNILKQLNRGNSLIIDSVEKAPKEKFKKLKPFRVGLYQNWGHNMVEGWTRFVFDEFDMPYETVHPRDIVKKNVLKKYDVLVFVGVHKRTIESGLPPKKWERWFSPLPPEYQGGLGSKGQASLESFLKAGKTLVFMGDACDYAIEKFKMPVVNIKEKNNKILCPGSYLRALVKKSELTRGLDGEIAIFYEEDPVFTTFLPRNSNEIRRTPVVFGSRDLLLSGWLEGERFLIRKSLVVDFKRDKGRIILIGPDIIHRAQSEGTYKIMFNALFTAAQ